MRHSGYRTARPVFIAACMLVLAACGSMPWSKKAPAAPQAVNELAVTGVDGAPAQAFPQYWKRNTLVVDLSAASGSGALVLKPGQSGKWPVRVAFRVMPGSIGLLEVQADQRMLLPVAREGTKATDLELVPGVYTAGTEQVRVRWEPAR